MVRLSLGLLLLSVAATAAAQQNQNTFSYSYISAAYNRADYDRVGQDGDGFGVGVSIEVNENFHLFGSYNGVDLSSSADAKGWDAGVGFNTPISNAMDVVVQLSYISTELSVGPFSVDDDGFGLSVGVRAMASDKIELDAGIAYVDTDSGSDTALEAGFLFTVSDDIAVGVGGSWDDDVSVWSLNGRLYFE